MAGLNDDIAQRIMGELDAMTKLIDQTTIRLDEQIGHLNSIESNIAARISTLVGQPSGRGDAPLNVETAAFLRREIHSIAVAAKNARLQNLHAIDSAVAETIRQSLKALDEQAGAALVAAAARFRTEIGMSATVASETANQSLKQICVDLNRKLQAMTSATAKQQWVTIVGASIVAAVIATVMTVHLVK